MACVKTGKAMVTKKQNQIEKLWYFSLDRSVQRETDLRALGAAGVSGDVSRPWISASVLILFAGGVRWRERRARKSKRQAPETKVAARKYINADFGEAVRSFEAGTRRTEAISRGGLAQSGFRGESVERDIRAMAGSTPAIPCPLFTPQNQPSIPRTEFKW